MGVELGVEATKADIRDAFSSCIEAKPNFWIGVGSILKACIPNSLYI
jgi:hypothetical protein